MSETPQLEWANLPQLLPLCIEFADKKHAGEAIDLREAVERIGNELGIEDVDSFALSQFKNAMEEGVGFAFEQENAKAIAAIFVKNAAPVMTAIAKFAQSEIDAPTLIRALNELCFGSTAELQGILQNSLHIPDALASEVAEVFGPYTVSIFCFAGAFKIYKTAAADAEEAKERRIEIERLANEAIAKLKAERAEMDKLLNDWLLSRLIPFGEGIQAMDRAILQDDDDAYIAANSDLWNLLGREAAYNNATEFDDLMLSDDVFKL